MCGFVGIYDLNSEANTHDSFMGIALKDLNKRGPDDQRQWIDDTNSVVFGFARLAIRDLSVNGSQPMISPSGEYTIVYNGETYNTEELCNWAEINRENLKGNSDTEIILNCFELKGILPTLKKIDGIFACAIWNNFNGELILSRDHAGVKPLYFGVSKWGVVFSSHYQHIVGHEFLKEEKISENALLNYFKFGFVQEGEGLFDNTFFLPHGHFVKFGKGAKLEFVSYFNLDDKPVNNGNANEKTKILNDILCEVVNEQMISDVPLGAFLSGGVDSNVIVGIAKEFNHAIKAFTIGVNDQRLDETAEAIRFANFYGVNHKIKKIEEIDIVSILDKYENSLGEPLCDISSLLTIKVCELAKSELTVVLSGDGGDELFWGYKRFKIANESSSFYNSTIIGKLRLFIASKLKGGILTRVHFDYKDFEDYYLKKQGIPDASHWINKLFVKNIHEKRPFWFQQLIKRPKLDNMEFARNLEFHIHMQRVLLKVDRASMYNSLEVRTPILSKRVIESSRSFKFEDCYQFDKGKLPLREILSKIIPNNEKGSGEKKGFTPPMDKWLRNELKERIGNRLANIPKKLIGVIDSKTIELIWYQHQNENKDWSWVIWGIYSLFVWFDKLEMFEKEN